VKSVEARVRLALYLGLAAGGCGSATLAPDGAARPDGAAQPDGASDAESEGGVDAWSAATLPDGSCIPGAFHLGGGVCACQPDSPDICGVGCVDLSTDNDNCGACGHACEATSACANGVCSPAPTTVVAAPAACGKMRLGALADTLVWSDTAGGRVMAMPGAGGAPQPISGAETQAPTLLAFNGSTIFWLDGKTIRKSAGGTISDVYTNLDDIHGLATSDDGATVYFSTGQRVQSVPAAGGGTAVDVEIHNSGDPDALAVSGNYLASTVGLVGGVNVIGLGGPTALCWTHDPTGSTVDVDCNRVAMGQGELNTDVIAATAGKVIWADGPNLKMGDLVVGGIPKSWDAVTQADTNVVSFAVSAGSIYFEPSDPSTPSSGIVAKVAMTANALSTPLVRHVAPNAPGSLAVVGPTVFWATSACEIQSAPTGE
jgi:hypothetical protein